MVGREICLLKIRMSGVRFTPWPPNKAIESVAVACRRSFGRVFEGYGYSLGVGSVHVKLGFTMPSLESAIRMAIEEAMDEDQHS